MLELLSSLKDFILVAFWAGQEVEIEFKVECEHFKHRFFKLMQVVFWAGEEAQNEFKLRCEPLYHRFIVY